MGKNSIIKVLNTCNPSIYKGCIYAVTKEKGAGKTILGELYMVLLNMIVEKCTF